MQSRVRSIANQLCKLASDTFTPHFGVPSTQNFGDVAAEGSSTDFARGDHLHGMPNLPADTIESLSSVALDFEEFLHTSTAGITTFEFYGTATLGGRDDLGDFGGFGTIDLVTPAIIGRGAGAYFAQSSGSNTSTQETYVLRVTRFEARTRFGVAASQLNNVTAAVGTIRSTLNGSSTANALTSANITDGLYFYLVTDSGGVGTWHARAVDNSNATDVDTGVSPRTDGTNVRFDIFRIDLNGSTATFYINGVVVATITSNLTTRKTCGWGSFYQTDTANARTMICDYMFYKGLRVA